MHATPTPSSAGQQAMPDQASHNTATGKGRLVTDAPMRMFHWLFAASFLGAYLTSEGERWRMLHVTLGYTMVGLLGWRVLYGLFGPRQVRLGAMWRKLAGAPAWLRSLGALDQPGGVNWRQGQNLLMALAIVSMLVLTVPLTLSGYALYNEWGDAMGGPWADGEWLEELHEFFGNGFLAIVLGHLGLILGLSVLRRRNQALPMLTGRTEGSGPDLVQHKRHWLAALILVAVIGFIAWQWQQSPKGLVPGFGGDGSAQLMSSEAGTSIGLGDDDEDD